MRAKPILLALLFVLLNTHFVIASTAAPQLNTPDTIPSSTPPAPGPAPNPIDELIAQLQTLNQGVAALNTTIHNEAEILASRWNQSNVEFKDGIEVVDQKLAPLNLLKLGAYIGLPMAVAELVGLSVLYCIVRRGHNYQKIINDAV